MALVLSGILGYNNFMIKVGFDISQLAHPGGVATYTFNLTKELIRVKDIDFKFFYSSLRKPYRGNLPNVKSFPIPPTLLEKLLNRWRFFNLENFIGDIDIYHSSDWTQSPSKAKKVTTYHDVIPLKFPHWSHPKIVDVHKKRLELVEKEIDMVICVSNSTKKDLMEISQIPEEKIIVIYEGVSEIFKPLDEKEVKNFKNKYNLPDQYVLATGGIGERKNLPRIKEATKNYNLVILGETIKDLPYDELPLLYGGAECLLHVSLYEGFGLSILEAMASGVPVITSSVSSMPEVAGDAAEYVNPESVLDIENKLRQVLEDEKKRKQMIKKGLEQAKKFSWQKCAEETANVYKGLTLRS